MPEYELGGRHVGGRKARVAPGPGVSPGPGSSRAGTRSVDCRPVSKTYSKNSLTKSTLQDALSMAQLSEHPTLFKYVRLREFSH